MRTVSVSLSGSGLTQFLITCPTCQSQSAVHVDETGNDGPVLVRVICPDRCKPDPGAVFDLVTTRLGDHLASTSAVA